MHVTFPSSTELINFQEDRAWLDDTVYLRIELPRADLDRFIADSPFSGRELRTDRRDVSADPSMRWLCPDRAMSYQSDQVRLPNAEYLNILIDLDDKDVLTIYLQWGET
jgi:hypothetical protein